MKVISGGVTSAKGFKANGLCCGIKRSGKFDLALITSEHPATSAGVFTRNSVKAAPVIVTKSHIQNNKAQAIIANSGNANCFTGHFGHVYAKRMAKVTSEQLAINENNCLVASTGIIGKILPIKKIEKATSKLARGLSKAGGKKAAKAILTTDTIMKQIAVQCRIGKKLVTIGGCAKGAGMIEPNMATMLSFITTDAAISATLLKRALKEAVGPSFNSITVDGCMSTNDMVVVMANGLANNTKITSKDKDYQTFLKALSFLCLDLAKKIIKDGEGATKFVEINVIGAPSAKKAKEVCSKIANSVLVKTAIYGSNPNWGRVAQAVGTCGLNATEKNLKVKFSSFKKKDITITVDLNLGQHKATVYTSDLSLEYVKINGKYN